MSNSNIYEAPFIKKICETTSYFARRGWAENNAGNISYIIEETDLLKYVSNLEPIWEESIDFKVPRLAGKLLVVTGAGKHFRNVEKNPSESLGIIKINNTGDGYCLIWGLTSGGLPTSELPSHLICHESRLDVDNNHKIIMHTHATNTIAMTLIHELDEIEFTKTLWRIITECIMVFPEGVSVLPWMVAGTSDLGNASAQKMKTSRVVIWPQHGIMSAGNNFDDAIGLIETVEKAAGIYISALQSNSDIWQDINDEELLEIVERFNLNINQNILNTSRR